MLVSWQGDGTEHGHLRAELCKNSKVRRRGTHWQGLGVSSLVPPRSPELHTVRFSLRCLRRFSASDWFVFVLFCFQCEDLRLSVDSCPPPSAAARSVASVPFLHHE